MESVFNLFFDGITGFMETLSPAAIEIPSADQKDSGFLR